jgi:hypothetical protein
MYGVTSRTIRDIWNHLSWAYATRHLWDVGPQLSAENRIDKPTVEAVSHLDLITCFGRNIFVTLCRKIARQAFAAQGVPRDLEAQLLERQMPSTVRRSCTWTHHRTNKVTNKEARFSTMKEFMSSRKRRQLSKRHTSVSASTAPIAARPHLIYS